MITQDTVRRLVNQLLRLQYSDIYIYIYHVNHLRMCDEKFRKECLTESRNSNRFFYLLQDTNTIMPPDIAL